MYRLKRNYKDRKLLTIIKKVIPRAKEVVNFLLSYYLLLNNEFDLVQVNKNKLNRFITTINKNRCNLLSGDNFVISYISNYYLGRLLKILNKLEKLNNININKFSKIIRISLLDLLLYKLWRLFSNG